MKKKLSHVTLIGVDCFNIDRLILAAGICQERFEFGSIKLLTSLPTDHQNAIKIEPVLSTEEYSKFVFTRLADFIETDFALVIQYDGFILNPDAWTDEFLKYDYIGAPWQSADWSISKFDFPKDSLGKKFVGNGGFSLRSKKLLETCKRLTTEGNIKKIHPEDVSLCIWNRHVFESNGIRFAPLEVAEKFSYEALTRDENKWNGQFGFHGLRWTDISNWIATHPEYKVDMKLNIFQKIHQ